MNNEQGDITDGIAVENAQDESDIISDQDETSDIEMDSLEDKAGDEVLDPMEFNDTNEIVREDYDVKDQMDRTERVIDHATGRDRLPTRGYKHAGR